MAWEGSNRKSRLPADWSARRLRVLRRDSYRCQQRDARGMKCGAQASDVDHIEHGDNHAESNLQAMCRAHHAAKSALEGVEAKRLKYRRERDTVQHPGLIR